MDTLLIVLCIILVPNAILYWLLRWEQDAYWAKRRAESCRRHQDEMFRRFGKVVECKHDKEKDK